MNKIHKDIVNQQLQDMSDDELFEKTDDMISFLYEILGVKNEKTARKLINEEMKRRVENESII